MKKILLFLLSVVVLVSCAETDKDKIKSQIKENKNTIKRLKKENEKLERDLAKFNDEQKKHKIPVVTKRISPITFYHFIEASGIVEADEIATISPEVPAQITKIHVTEGQYVKR